MCGIVGIMGARKDGLSKQQWQDFAEAWKRAQSRGSDACGFIASVQGRLEFWKAAIPSSEAVKDWARLMPYRPGIRFILGHTRYATSGKPSDNLNNHPIVTGPGKALLGIHNGVIGNKAELLAAHGWTAARGVDTEIAFRLIDHYGVKSLKPFEQMLGLFNLAYAERAYPGTFYLVRKGNPLTMKYAGKDGAGMMFGSLPGYWAHVEGREREVKDNTVTRWTRLGPVETRSFKPCDSWLERGAACGWARKAKPEPKAGPGAWHEIEEDGGLYMDPDTGTIERTRRNIWD